MNGGAAEQAAPRPEWNTAAARAFEDHPNLQRTLLDPGTQLTADPSSFLHDIAQATGGHPVAAGLGAIFDVFEFHMGRYFHIKNEDDDLIGQLRMEKVTLNEQIKMIGLTLAQRLNDVPDGRATLVQGGRRQSRDPSPFNGETKDIAKRQEEYLAFRTSVERCVAVDIHIFDTNFRQIQFLAGLLAGEALVNNQAAIARVTRHPAEEEQWPIGWKTVHDALDQLDKQYITIDLARQASIDYDNCFMKKRPFQSFIAEFVRLATRCHKTNEQMVADLKLKVSQELIDVSAQHLTDPDKSDIGGWVTRWQSIYDKLEDKAHLDKLRASKGSEFRPQTQKPQPSEDKKGVSTVDEYRGEPMQLDKTQVQRISREECQARGLCFYCKKPGHAKADCTEKKKNDARYGRNGNGRGQALNLPPHQNVPIRNQPYSPQYTYGWPPVRDQQPVGRGRGGNPPRYPTFYNQPYVPNLREVDMGGFVENVDSPLSSPEGTVDESVQSKE